jgi:hypothetical protein
MRERQVISLLDRHADLAQWVRKRGRHIRMHAYASRELGATGMRSKRRAHERGEGQLAGLSLDVWQQCADRPVRVGPERADRRPMALDLERQIGEITLPHAPHARKALQSGPVARRETCRGKPLQRSVESHSRRTL